MKQTITKALLLIFCLMPFLAMSQAEYSNYYIEGDYAMHQGQGGKMYYTLTNIETKGVKLGTGHVTSLVGGVGSNESVVFTFDTIENYCPDGYKYIRFWKAKDNEGPIRWQIDSEVENPRSKKRTDMVKVVLLVLDCSNSLGNDFDGLQKCAKKFVDILVKSSGNGNIRIGVIGFSNVANTDKNVIPIQNLTKQSAQSIKDAIDDLNQHNNTAMYYAMDKGEKMISDYVQNLQLADDQKFGGAIMVTFTDGFDNHSLMEGRVFRKGLENPYFQYVRDTVIRHQYTYTHKNVILSDGSRRDIVESHPLESMMLVLKGNDVSEDDKTYQNVFNSLASEQPYYVKNFSEVKKKFSEIAELIVSRFQVLECYVPRAHEGRVRWTFDEPHGFFGISAGPFGEVTTLKSRAIGVTFGFDFGFPTKDYCAWGGFLNCKLGFINGGYLYEHASFGVLHAGQQYQYKKAFLWGVGADLRIQDYGYHYVEKNNSQTSYYDNLGYGLVFRGGLISGSHFYCYADLTIGYFQMYKETRTETYYTDRWGYRYTDYNYKSVGPYHRMYFTLGVCAGFKF